MLLAPPETANNSTNHETDSSSSEEIFGYETNDFNILKTGVEVTSEYSFESSKMKGPNYHENFVDLNMKYGGIKLNAAKIEAR